MSRSLKLPVNSLCAGSLVLALSACGGSQLAPKFAPPETPTEAKVAENIVKASPRQERAVLVGVLADAPKLAAWDFNGSLLWEIPVEAKSAPLVVGDAVVLREAAGVVVRDLATGAERVTLDDGGELVGADGVGNALVVSLAFKDEAGSHGSLVFVVGDSVRWEKELAQAVGTPALVENQVLVPWGTQHLSVLSADNGAELARWTFHNLMVGQALVDRERVFVGQLGWLKVEKDLPAHQDGPLTLLAPTKRVLPGQPPLLRDGYAVVPEPDHATHKVKLEWRPGATPGVVEGDLAVFRFYRMAFGVAGQEDRVRWVRTFEHDLVGSATQPGGVFLADDQGVVRFVDGQGATRSKLELKRPLRAVSLRPGSFVPALAGQALENLEPSLHDQLLSAARLDDDRLFPGRAFAVQHLAHTDDARLTAELIGLCTKQNGLGNAAQLAACDELAKRDGNSKEILEALRQRASFLEGTSAPPVGALAQAAARSKLKAAAPLLLARAEDPNTPASELVPVFQALEGLEYAPAIAWLDRFVRLHHAEPAGSDLAAPLQTALDVLGKLRAKNARGTLEAVANDELTLEPIRQKAKDALAVLDAPPPKHEEPKAEPVKAKQVAPEPEPALTDPRPYALDSAAVQKAFRPLQAAIERCLEADASKPKSVRLAMIVTGGGQLEGFFATPTSVQGCADAILRNAKFPETRLARQHVTQTVYAEGASLAPAAPTAAPTNAAPGSAESSKAKP
ncbi:MAG: hypothetical protein QM778_05970 [Myxococcales bacterium]